MGEDERYWYRWVRKETDLLATRWHLMNKGVSCTATPINLPKMQEWDLVTSADVPPKHDLCALCAKRAHQS